MKSGDILAINLKYYRKKYKLSQQQFAQKVGSSKTYINQLENKRKNPSIDILDQIANGINNIDNNANIKGSDLITYNKNNITNFKRIDEKK